MARSSISEISERIDFPRIELAITVGFDSFRIEHDFYCEPESPGSSSYLIAMGNPKLSPLLDHFGQSGNKSAFLQTSFLHEIAHAIFDPIFSRVSHSQIAKLRTIHSDLSGSSLADEIPLAANNEHRNFLVDYLGDRMEERFCDSFSILASAKLAVPISSSRELASNRSKEADFSLYDTAHTLSRILQEIESGSISPSSLDLMQCADLAKSFALDGFRQDLSHPCLSDIERIGSLMKDRPSISLGGARFFQERLDSRRAPSCPSGQAFDGASLNPSDIRASRF